MISYHMKPRRWLKRLRRRPLVLAAFSYRYDHHLVPDLLRNLEPITDGWIAYDDRASREAFSAEMARRRLLIAKARELGAGWVLAVDPDERFEVGLADRIADMTAALARVIWCFDIRELYAPDRYRVDGIWGQKTLGRLFPLIEGQTFADQALHGPWYPVDRDYDYRRTGLNLYHLKMIARARRVARRDLYRHLDPQNRFQAIGYDYLADDAGAVLETIPPGRHYLPPHVDDGALWMADPARQDDTPSDR